MSVFPSLVTVLQTIIYLLLIYASLNKQTKMPQGKFTMNNKET